MKRAAQFALGALGGLLTSALWFSSAGESLPWRERLSLLWVPVVVLAGLAALGRLRRQFAPAFGYLIGLSPVVALYVVVVFGVSAFQGWQSLYAFSERLQRRPFESAAWRQHPDDPTRARMSDDLILGRKLVAT